MHFGEKFRIYLKEPRKISERFRKKFGINLEELRGKFNALSKKILNKFEKERRKKIFE